MGGGGGLVPLYPCLSLKKKGVILCISNIKIYFRNLWLAFTNRSYLIEQKGYEEGYGEACGDIRQVRNIDKF